MTLDELIKRVEHDIHNPQPTYPIPHVLPAFEAEPDMNVHIDGTLWSELSLHPEWLGDYRQVWLRQRHKHDRA